MLMLKAFIDDSHSGPTGPVFVLAGYISTAEKWASFAEKWQAILDEPPKLEYFKMVEAFNRRDQFEGWDVDARDVRLKAFVDTINDYAMEGVVSILPLEPFNRIFFSNFPSKRFWRLFERLYFVSFYGIMATVFHYMEVRQIDGKVDFIFDKGNEAPVNILWAYDSFVNSAPADIRRHIGALTPVFEDDKNRDFLPLQAADMLAWQARRHHRELMGLTSPRDDFAALQKLSTQLIYGMRGTSAKWLIT